MFISLLPGENITDYDNGFYIFLFPASGKPLLEVSGVTDYILFLGW